MSKHSVLAVAALSVMALSACTKNTDNVTPPQPPSKYYKDSVPQNVSATVTNHTGVQIAMANNKDFMNEAEYLRILALLDSHQDLIKPQAGDIEKINIGGSSNIEQLADGRYEIELGFNVSEDDIVRLFTEGFGEYKEMEKKSQLFKTVIPLTIVDTVGLKGDALDAATAKLKMIALAIDFSQAQGFSTLILGSAGYTLNQNGMTINIMAPVEQTITQLRLGMDARMSWAREISKLSQDLGITFSLAFQPGVFDGIDLAKVITNAQTKTSMISSLNQALDQRFTTIIFGRRFDYDLNSNTALIQYDASEADIAKWFHGLKQPETKIDFEVPRNEIQSAFAAKGCGARVAIFMTATSDNLKSVRSFESTATDIDGSLLQKLSITAINLGTDATSYTPATNTLNISVTDSSTNVNQYLSTYILKSAFTQSNLDLSTYITLLAGTTGVSLENGVTFASSQSQNDRLAGFVAWFTRSVDANRVNATKMTSLRLSDVGDSTTFSGGILSVDLQTFDPAQMGKILVAPQPSPAPHKKD